MNVKNKAEIIYEDEEIFVLNKAYGVDSEVFSKENGLFAVHRLDKTTKGLIVFAKTAHAASALSRQITDGGFTKLYAAVAEGVFEEKTGRMEDLLFHDRNRNKTYVVDRERSGVKKACLEYKVVSENNGFSLLEIKLLTGRTHQIRAQLASRRHPLKNDRRYGGKGNGEISLESVSLGFFHPKTGEKMCFSLDYGKEMLI